MSVITGRDRDVLKREFRKDLKNDVTIRLFTQRPSILTIPGRDCRYCTQTQQLMEELTSLSNKLHLEVYDFTPRPRKVPSTAWRRIPAIVMGQNGDSRVKFYGIPMGLEFPTIIEGIKTLSRGVSPLTMDSRKNLRKVNQRIHIQVFVTPSCGYCPALARLAHASAIENPLITADVIEVEEFPSLAQMYGVRGVPKTVIGTASQLTGLLPQVQFVGAATEAEFVAKIQEAGVKSTSEESAS